MHTDINILQKCYLKIKETKFQVKELKKNSGEEAQLETFGLII